MGHRQEILPHGERGAPHLSASGSQRVNSGGTRSLSMHSDNVDNCFKNTINYLAFRICLQIDLQQVVLQ